MAAKRLLIVDDEPEFGTLVRRVGERLGFEVTVLDRPLDFESTYERVRPSTILLDLVMPRMDGIEIIRWLIQTGNKAKVVICTGYNPQYAHLAEVLAKASGLFPVVALTKPASLDDLSVALQPELTAK